MAAALEEASTPTHNVFLLISDALRREKSVAVEPKVRRGVDPQGLFRFSTDERWLAHVHLPEPGERSVIRLWDVEARRPAGRAPLRPAPASEHTPSGAPTWRPTSLAFARGGQSVLALYRDNVLVEWDRNAGTSSSWEGVPPCSGAGQDLDCSADGRTVVVVGNASWRPWDAERRRWANEGGNLGCRITGICVSADGQLFAACDIDGTIRLVDIPSARERVAIVGQHHILDSLGMTFSPDGRTLATLSHGTVRLWQVATGLELFALDHTPGGGAVPGFGGIAIRFRTDGRALVAAGPREHSTRVIVWHAAPAVEWMDKNKPKDDELRRFRAEAEEGLGVKAEPQGAPPRPPKD
jgi:WD40 repeat protein